MCVLTANSIYLSICTMYLFSWSLLLKSLKIYIYIFSYKYLQWQPFVFQGNVLSTLTDG